MMPSIARHQVADNVIQTVRPTCLIEEPYIAITCLIEELNIAVVTYRATE